MNNAPITFTNGTLPEGFCFTTWQQTFNTFTSLLNGYLPGQYTVWNYGNTEPAASERGNPWLRLNSDGSPDKIYVFWSGEWVSPHPVPYESPEIRIWSGLIADLVDYDGGAAGTVTDTTGPMWEEVVAMRALFPLGAGTLASGTVVGVGDTGGEEKHSLIETEMPPHSHTTRAIQIDPENDNRGYGVIGQNESNYTDGSEFSSTIAIKSAGGTGDPAVVVAHNTIPPYIGVAFIQRTARKFYTP